jgi:enoyl-CoA hydratase/carnithine racemase
VSTEAPEILLAVRDGVATVTFNRPDRLNAVTPTMAGAYVDALLQCDDDPAVRVVVVTGAGRAFCAGADLGELSQGADYLDEHFGSPSVAPDTALRVRKPVIAAVNGPVAGLGFAYLLVCDIRLIDPSATLQTSFAKLGLVAEYGLSWLLPRTIGYSRATELLMSSRPIGADEAQRIGLAHAVSAPGTVVDEAVAYARNLIATSSPASWAAVKSQLLTDGARGFDDCLAETYGLMRASFRGPDVAEALAARAEKRAPSFADLPPRPRIRT